eukprot:COSAG06_NODE_55296_length_290_cov_0.811518_1_plen_44_part_10
MTVLLACCTSSLHRTQVSTQQNWDFGRVNQVREIVDIRSLNAAL